jgi:RNA polymerase sigma factor (sigma-70 family)
METRPAVQYPAMAEARAADDRMEGTAPSAVCFGRRELEKAYDEHASFVFRALRHLGVANADLDDAVQDTFLVLVRRGAALDHSRSLRSWLFGVAILVGRRFRQRRARTAAREVEAEVPTGGKSPFEATADARDASLLLRALDALPDEQRETFVLMELEGLTAVEVSRELGVKLNTVYSRLRLARRDVHARLRSDRERVGDG